MTEYVVMIDSGDMSEDPELVYIEAQSAESACVQIADKRPEAADVLSMDADMLPDIPPALMPYPDKAHMRRVGAVSMNWQWHICRDPGWADYVAEACIERRDGLVGPTALAIR